ncbi:MAG: hypothetical protein RIR48_460, partial [Bacteroidota bacterium]
MNNTISNYISTPYKSGILLALKNQNNIQMLKRNKIAIIGTV